MEVHFNRAVTAVATKAGAAAVYPVTLPTAAAVPAVTYRIVGASSKMTFSTRGTERARIEVTVWAKNYLDAVTIRAALIDGLVGFTDGCITVTYLTKMDFFDYELLKYRAQAEFYVSFAL